ncbi:MAG: single-stranded-DNA-specific exonuclease RecJ [Chloroflexi bacterium]|nr:single-stranded-DNA-specific exonuclease RecJ [Chloroflexota bacterium]
MKNLRWRVLPRASREALTSLAGSLPMAGGGELLLAQLLHNRGVIDPGEARMFLFPDESLSHDPFLLNDMDVAVQRIVRAVQSQELIAVYGDYDVDGVTSTVLLVQTLTHFGARACHYIPHRIEEGYGLNVAALASLAERGVKLVIAVDCGANAVEEAEYVRSQGMDLIIADHHAISPAERAMPSDIAVLNPKRPDSTYPFSQLAGVGVTFKLAQALIRVEGRGYRVERGDPSTLYPLPSTHYPLPSTLAEGDLLDLVALGTVADVVPLVGENRYLVKRGLEVINATGRIGLLQLMARCGLKPGAVDAGSIGFVLGPRLNAPGRLGSAADSHALLSATDAGEAVRLAEALETKNGERQRLADECFAAACEALAPETDDSAILVAMGRSFPVGVAGLVAGKLADRFYRPAVVVEERDDICRGSARSIPEFNIVQALQICGDCLVRFGGHAQAAGFAVRRADMPRLRERLAALADVALRGADGLIESQPTLTIDAEVTLSRLSGQVIRGLQRLAPFGPRNPSPLFLSRRVKVMDSRQVGAHGDHLRLRLWDGRNGWQAIGFGLGDMASTLSDCVDVVYSPEESVWNGERSVQLRVSDLRASEE